MYVTCPGCQSVYSITAAQLGAAGGRVRCSQCRTVFDAVSAVFDDPRQAGGHPPPQDVAREIDALVDRALDQVPAAALGLEQTPAAEPQPPAPPPDGLGAGEAPVALSAGGDRRATASEAPVSPDPGGHRQPFPSSFARSDADCYAHPCAAEFVTPRAAPDDDESLDGLLLHPMTFPPEPRTRWGALAAALLLTVTLMAQYVWWDRNRLAQISAIRPALDWLCQPLACNLPLRHDLARVEMVEREVRDHPNVKDALLVSAAFVNRANFVQAYPVLQIAFSDISGAPVAVRRFRPEEYLHERSPARGMAPGEQTLVMLEVVDPGQRAVSFQFDFL